MKLEEIESSVGNNITRMLGNIVTLLKENMNELLVDTIISPGLDSYTHSLREGKREGIEKFICLTYKYWDDIYDKNFDYFKQLIEDILSKKGESENTIVTMIKENLNILDKASPKMIDRLFLLLKTNVQLSIRYLDMNKMSDEYYMPHIDISSLFEKWKVKKLV